jgi:hypothetical protein
MKKSLLSLTLIGLAAATAGCTKFQSTRSITAPTVAAAPSLPGGTTSGTMVGNWSTRDVGASFVIPDPKSCSNFQWDITSQSSTAIAGTFTAICDGGVSIEASGTGSLIDASTVGITVTGVAVIAHAPACNFTLNGTGAVVDPNTLTVPYTGTTCVGPVQGTQTLRRHVDPPPPPPPPPAPDPVPEPVGGGIDMLDLTSVAVYNSPTDIASWPITERITSITFGPYGPSAGVTITTDPVLPNYWKLILDSSGDNFQYTVWAVVNVGGRWYTSGFIQMWQGRGNTGAPILTDFATNWAYDRRWGPMMGHQPSPGEQMGFFISAGNARGIYDVTSVRERSNVVVVPVPGGDTGYYSW